MEPPTKEEVRKAEEDQPQQGEDMFQQKLHKAAKYLAKAKRIVVYSGAGISAESGISTFRAPEVGVWANKVGLALYGTPFGWWLTPKLAWSIYLSKFRDPIARAKPNRGHYAITELQHVHDSKSDDHSCCIITQNVDGLHQRAGSPNSLVHELHGTVYRHICSKNRHLHPYVLDPATLKPPSPSSSASASSSSSSSSAQRDTGEEEEEKGEEEYDPEKDEFFTHDKKKFPRCQECGSYLRPDAVLFTEGLPDEAWTEASLAVARMTKGDCMIIVGTSGVVYPAASLADRAIAKGGVRVIEVNPEPSTFSNDVDVFLQGPSGQVLPALVEELKSLSPPSSS
ncbi:NAD-dependent protein deacylase [Balamuthia mandrillaris]